MAIIVEAYGIIIKHSAVVRCFRTYTAFLNIIPNNTHAFNGELHRITLMVPEDVHAFAKVLQEHGLKYIRNGECIDFAVVDMLKGPMESCPWLGFSRKKFFEGMTEFKRCNEDFSIAWLLPPGRGYGIPCDKDGRVDIASHAGWTPDNAFHDVRFVPENKIDSHLIELNKEKGVTQYWYSGTGEIVYSGRPEIQKESLISKISKLWMKWTRRD